jgi:hypothetical protein
MKKTFFLGVGAQKAGTTWLHRYLSRCPNFNFGSLKEYHIWDALYINECRNHLLPVPWFSMKVCTQFKMQRIPGAYERYFSRLIKGDADSTGDITPSYAGLKAAHFKRIKQRLENKGFDLKVIFLMRDPFERCCSQARMDKRKLGLTESVVEYIGRVYRTHAYSFRTEYNETINQLEQVFSPNQIYYGLYEEMFTPEKIVEISKFCGVDADISFAGETVNMYGNDKEIVPDALRAEIISYYSHVYDFCHKRFPQTKTLWGRR